MIDKDKSLISKKDTIFSKISNFFKNIFHCFNKKLVIFEEPKDDENEAFQKQSEITEKKISKNNEFLEIYLDDYVEDSDDEYNYEKIQTSENDKKNFFKLYENVKNGNIDMNYLSGNDLVKINLMLKEEMNLKINANDIKN